MPRAHGARPGGHARLSPGACRLYLVTDRSLMSTRTLEQAIEAACQGGVTMVQVREKHLGHDELVACARSIKRITDAFGVPLIINDDARVAAQVGAAGVHVGQADIPVAEARRIVGPTKVIGVSAHTVDEALAAAEAGADYLGVGAMNPTSTKENTRATSIQTLRQIVEAVAIPCVAIGGIDEAAIERLVHTGVAGFALVSAIMTAPDIQKRCHELREQIDALQLSYNEAGNEQHPTR